MSTYRDALPQLDGSIFLTDSGIETDLIFHHGYELPEFAAFPLVDDESGAAVLRNYYRQHAQVAKDSNVGFILEAATWRANIDWASLLGYSEVSLDRVTRSAVAMLVELRGELGESAGPLVISGAVGPRGDAYSPGALMRPEEAQRYHSAQIETFAKTQIDLVTALTLTHTTEAIGIANAAAAVGIPAVISFTVEVDGKLPDGTALGDAIEIVDKATSATGSLPAYYGINCAHPTHFLAALSPDAAWTKRIRMIRANASRMSHAELDNASDLDDGDPDELGREYAEILERFPHINVLGGCCGTDVRHIRSVAAACIGPGT